MIHEKQKECRYIHIDIYTYRNVESDEAFLFLYIHICVPPKCFNVEKFPELQSYEAECSFESSRNIFFILHLDYNFLCPFL